MTIREEQNPLSTANRVRDRLEKHASGVEPSSRVDVSRHAPHISRCNQLKADHPEDLTGEFLGLLFNPLSDEPKASPDKGFNDHSNKSSPNGTNCLISSLNKQEECFGKLEDTKEPFTMVIENTTLGALRLRGRWSQGVLQLALELPKRLSLTEQKVLGAMLSKGLSKQLGVPMEISID
ncbi:hypothetical protein [Limnobacter sp.]|uniref:hypothetical protein n=1 Tax=Limnobacter sp. TaxID=2003368 RepID=UPI003517FD77